MADVDIVGVATLVDAVAAGRLALRVAIGDGWRRGTAGPLLGTRGRGWHTAAPKTAAPAAAAEVEGVACKAVQMVLKDEAGEEAAE